MSNNVSNQQQNIDPILGFDPWYLRPPKEAIEIKHSDHYIKHNDKKKGNRKVYQKVQYDDFEKKHIEIIQQEMEKQQIQVPPDWKTSDYLKMCYCGRFDPKKDIDAAKKHIEWRNNINMHTIDDKSRALLLNGMIYLLGRDPQFRPIIYLDCTKISLKKDGEETILKALCVFLDMVKKYMFIDYHIENWIMVIDTGGLGLSSLPINGLRLIIGNMSINYCATMDKMYILNPSFMLNTSWNVIKGFIDPESVDKITFLKPKDYKEMQKKIPIRFLQKKYGGEHQDITQFWPPMNVYCSEEERAKLLKNQNIKQKDKDAGSVSTSPNKKNSIKKEDKPVLMNTQESIKQKPDSSNMGKSNSREISTNGANGQTATINLNNNSYPQIVNDGIKPKIVVTTVKDDHVDNRYAVAGYDEQLEIRLRQEADRKRQESEQIKKQQLQREDSQTQSGSQAFNIKKGIVANSSGYNAGVSTTATGTVSATAAPNISSQYGNNNTSNTNTINNINITSTDYSEINHPSPSITHKNHKNYNSAIPDTIDSKQEDSSNTNLNKYQNGDEETDPIIFEPHNMHNNPIIQFEGDDSAAASKCCQNCTIF